MGERHPAVLMNIGQLKDRIKALFRGDNPPAPVTLQDKLIAEYMRGYNRAVIDVLVAIEKIKKEDGSK